VSPEAFSRSTAAADEARIRCAGASAASSPTRTPRPT
jgi:hypothetical protein